VNAEGEILRIRPGAVAYAVTQAGLGSVELVCSCRPRNFKCPSPSTNTTALCARLGETRAEFFTPVEVNGSLSVSGTDVGAAQGAKHRVKRVTFGAGITGGTDAQPDGSQNVSIRVSDSLALAGDLSVTGKTRHDVFKGRTSPQVTCEDNLAVTGSTFLQGRAVQSTIGMGVMRLRHDTTAMIVERLSGGTWRRAATIGHDDSFGGAVATDNLASNGLAILNNVEISGNLTGWTPFFSAGYVDGTDLSILPSRGVAFTVSRNPTYPTGIDQITFAMPHPAGDNYVIIAHSRNDNSYLTPAPITGTPVSQTATFFCITLRNVGATTVANEQFHFMVLR
jgi:hypothetical protein